MAEDLITEKSLLSSLRKMSVNFGKARAFQTIDLSDGLAHKLTVPIYAQYAIIAITTATPSTTVPVVWFRMDGKTVVANSGLPIFGQFNVDITDYENLNNFSIIGTTGGEKVFVQYFSLQY